MTPTPRTTRRTFLSLAAASTLVPLGLSAGTAQAASSASASTEAPRAVPRTIALPNGFRPEGITSGPRTTYYVGSLADGRIVTGDLRTGSLRTLLPGATGRSLRGLAWDRRTGLVWAVGNLGAVSHVWAVDDTTGAVVSETVVPGAVFLNDLVVVSTRAFVTDSGVDRLTVIALDGTGMPTGADPTFLPLRGAWPSSSANATNANGIRQLPDGTLVLNNSRVGGLWRVKPATGITSPIPVTGGPALTGGDGLEIHGRVLYDVRATGNYQVSVLRLSRTGSGWEATWISSLTDETLDVPSTATLAGGWLWTVNARFGVASPSTASYRITRLPTR